MVALDLYLTISMSRHIMKKFDWNTLFFLLFLSIIFFFYFSSIMCRKKNPIQGLSIKQIKIKLKNKNELKLTVNHKDIVMHQYLKLNGYETCMFDILIMNSLNHLICLFLFYVRWSHFYWYIIMHFCSLMQLNLTFCRHKRWENISNNENR